ncbi:MAG: hypothetical protein IKR15_06430 [Bacteroidales bacterium]|nr:hypothetical protein [Bacteroidales bacterium]
MKKVLFIGMALLSMAAVSCSIKEVAFEQAPEAGNTVILGASVEQTKAAISDAGAFSWQEGDAISVATNADLVDFELIDGAGKTTASFKATFPDGVEMGQYAISPAGKHVVAGDEITINLPAEYVYAEDVTNIPMVGSISENKVKFAAVGGVARFKAGIPAGAAKVALATDKKITGDFKVAEGKIAAGEGADKVVYTLGTVEQDKNMTFNFPLPVGEYSMTFQILDAEDNVLNSLEGSAPHAIKAADVLIFDELEFPAPGLDVTLTRVWGKYHKDGQWFSDLETTRADWNRNGTICGSYIYLPVVNNGTIGVYDLAGNYVSTISGFAGTGTFKLDAIAKLGNAVYASSMSTGGGFTIYKLTGKDSNGMYTSFEVAAQVAADNLPASYRFGDRMTAFGTDKEGVLLFVDYSSATSGGEQCRSNLQFSVKDGVVDPVPVKAQYLVTNNKPSMQGIYILSGGPGDVQHALYAGNQVETYFIGLNSWLSTEGWWEMTGAGVLPAFTTNVNDPRVFSAGGKDYLAYVVADGGNSETGVLSYLNIVEIPAGEGNVAQRIATITDIDGVSAKYGLTDPNDLAARAGAGMSNGTGYCEITYVNGEAYLLAGADVAGMSLFKIEGATIPAGQSEPENLAITPDGVGTIEGTTATIAFDRANYPTEPIKLTYTLDGTPVEKTISGVMHVTLKNVPKVTKYVFFEIYPIDGSKFLFDKATADLSVENPALVGEGNDNAFIPVSLAADGDLEFNLPILTGSFNATNFKVELFTDGPSKWDKKVGLAKLEKPFAATTVKPGDVFDFVFEWEKPAGVTIDGNFIDWLYDDPAKSVWTLPEDALLTSIKTMKLAADLEYVYMYLETVEDGSETDYTPMDVLINSDGNNATGCYLANMDDHEYATTKPYENPGIEWYLEGIMQSGPTTFADYTGLQYYLKYHGSDGDTFWHGGFDKLNDDFAGKPEKIYAQGMIDGTKGQIELRFSREAFGMTGSKAALGFKFMDGANGWRAIGFAPQISPVGGAFQPAPELLYIDMTPIAAPEPISITIDGDMSDWANVAEAASSDSGSYCSFKVHSDDTNIYFYSKRTTDRMSELWGGAGYYYYAFDTDNNAETGDGALWGNGPYEAIMALFVFGGSADAPVVTNPVGESTVAPSGTVANIVCRGVVTADGVESELVIPRADLPAIPSGQDITISTWGNKGANKLTATVQL